MSAMKELSIILDEMISAGNSMVKAATALKNFYSSTAETEVVTAPVEDTKVAEKTYTLEEVRAILSAKSKAGFREQVKELITKRGADNLTKLDPSDYPMLVNEVEGLTNG